GFRFQARTALARELVELRFPSRIGGFPIGFEQTTVLEAAQRGIERALLHLHDVARHLLQALRNRVAVNRPKRDYFEDEEIERALRQIGLESHYHTSSFYTLTRRRVEVQGVERPPRF